ncbi:MAG TPA: hypothetical protein VMZ91_15930 [Candidatus Paceibacterota bacterium]|nr:hypothetical protein [Candidatus Paceibacterota bacterium]
MGKKIKNLEQEVSAQKIKVNLLESKNQELRDTIIDLEYDLSCQNNIFEIKTFWDQQKLELLEWAWKEFTTPMELEERLKTDSTKLRGDF